MIENFGYRSFIKRGVLLKSIKMHDFYQYASQFKLKSIIKAMSILSFELINSLDGSTNMFISQKYYHVTYQGKQYSDTVLVAQTKLIDVIYEVISSGVNGKKDISIDESLRLIHLLTNLENDNRSKEEKKLKELNIDKEIFAGLNLFGYLGEQKKFQHPQILLENFCREKYILETISTKADEQLEFAKAFKDETSMTTDEYSSLILILFTYFFGHNPCCSKKTVSEMSDMKPEFAKIITSYTTTIDEIKCSDLKRQIFYSKPILKIDNEYICVNPFLLLFSFVNSNFWVIRNKFLREGSRRFTSLFGKYFELYLEELLSYYLDADKFKHIPESNRDNRADWYIKTDKYEFLIEQKSTISRLSIKQNTPNIEDLIIHIKSCWGKAVKQLTNTEKSLKISNAIKIILVYDDYYQCESLDLLFKLDTFLVDDNLYWLVTIREFEMLMHLYKTSPDLFDEIINEKIEAETKKSLSGRDLSYFLSQHGITENQYLIDTAISDNLNTIKAIIDKELNIVNN